MTIDLTLQDLFGAKASQDNNSLIVFKSDLPNLTIDANNRAEQLLVGLIVNAQSFFEGVLIDEFEDSIIDELGNVIIYNNSELYNLEINYWRKIYAQTNNQLYLINQFVVTKFS